MSENISNYANLLKTRRILYVPICVFLEKLTTLYGYLARLANEDRRKKERMSELPDLLMRFLSDLISTSQAYDSGRVNFFAGDWRSVRDRADKVMYNLLIILRRFSAQDSGPANCHISDIAAALASEWEILHETIDGKPGFGNTLADNAKIRYFCSARAGTWQNTSATIIQALDEQAHYDSPDTYLILLCYNRVKTRFVRQIELLEHKNKERSVFNPDRIVCAYEANVNRSCPTCMVFCGEMHKAPQQRTRKDTQLHCIES